jgi:Fur family zinc uptake transcriptional regulator
MMKPHPVPHPVANATVIRSELATRSGSTLRYGSLSDRVKHVIGRQAKPISVYAITDLLQQETCQRHFPNSIYRALRRLANQGEVLEVVSMNGWLLRKPNLEGPIMLLLCRKCGGAEQVVQTETGSAIESVAAPWGFTVKRTHIEILGSCRACNTTAGDHIAA